MAELVPGDEIPADCTAVGKLPVRMLTSTDGALAYVTGTGVTSVGKLLLSSREQDYRDAFTDNGLTICDDDELGYDFCKYASPLRLPLKGNASRIQVLINGCDSGHFLVMASDIRPQTHAFMTLVLQLMMNTVTKGDRKILMAAENDVLFGMTVAEFYAYVWPGVDFTGWELAYSYATGSVTGDNYSNLVAALSDPTVSIIIKEENDLERIKASPNLSLREAMEESAEALRDHVAAGGGLIAGQENVQADDLNPPPWTVDLVYSLDGIDLYTRYGLPMVYGYTWLDTVFPGMTRINLGDSNFLEPPPVERDVFQASGPVTLTDACLAMIPGTTATMLWDEADLEFIDGGVGFGGDLNGMQYLATCGRDLIPLPAFVQGYPLIGGIPSYSALA